MFLAYFLAVASLSSLSKLVLCVVLADAVLANQIWRTAICGVAEVAYAAKSAVALFQDVWVERYCCNVTEAGLLQLPLALARLWLGGTGGWWRQVFVPVKVATRGIGAFENILQRGPGGILWPQRVDAGCRAFV